MKPCSKTIVPSATVKNTRATPWETWERTSQRPASIFLIRGIPSGQPYCAVLMSSPVAFRSHRSIPLSHWRTGSFPASVRKKTTRRTGPFACSPPSTTTRSVSKMMHRTRLLGRYSLPRRPVPSALLLLQVPATANVLSGRSRSAPSPRPGTVSSMALDLVDMPDRDSHNSGHHG
jgi:hypothetical protein